MTTEIIDLTKRMPVGEDLGDFAPSLDGNQAKSGEAVVDSRSPVRMPRFRRCAERIIKHLDPEGKGPIYNHRYFDFK